MSSKSKKKTTPKKKKIPPYVLVGDNDILLASDECNVKHNPQHLQKHTAKGGMTSPGWIPVTYWAGTRPSNHPNFWFRRRNPKYRGAYPTTE